MSRVVALDTDVPVFQILWDGSVIVSRVASSDQKTMVDCMADHDFVAALTHLEVSNLVLRNGFAPETYLDVLQYVFSFRLAEFSGSKKKLEVFKSFFMHEYSQAELSSSVGRSDPDPLPPVEAARV